MLKRFMQVGLVATMLPLINGCVHHLSEVECKLTDWRQMGVTDGAAGNNPRDLKTNVEDCQKFNVPVDVQAYKAGFSEGVGQFCQPSQDVGVQYGAAGKPYTEINSRSVFCANYGKVLDLKAFAVGYKQGLASYCVYENGKALGLTGEQPNSVCSSTQFSLYQKGWAEGVKTFCGSPDTGFTYGKSGKTYPVSCNPSEYSQFKRQYDRGVQIKQRLDQLNQKLDQTNKDINSLVTTYGFVEQAGNYVLGQRRDLDAVLGLQQVRGLVQQREQLKNDIFNVNVMQ